VHRLRLVDAKGYTDLVDECVDRARDRGMTVESHELFVGVDIAGNDNTWVAGLTPSARGLQVAFGPKLANPEQLLAVLSTSPAIAVAIDGQLSLAFSDANGFRSSDRELRALLPADCRTWVASANSLMAVPLRANLLAERIRPDVGTVLETHPRASLLLELGPSFLRDVKDYKRSVDAVTRLSFAWAERFSIHGGVVATTDGALDALVCATVAFCFHREPQRLRYLRHTAPDRRGGGPFVVMDCRGR
jgi:predicted nuclease with RNAse H fold